MAEKLSESFKNLAMVAMAKSETINTMAQSISKLTSTNTKLTVTIKKLTSQLETALNKNINSNDGGESKWSHNPDGYCFTCGYKVTKRHDSKTCRKGANNTDHKKEATRQNTMGGTTKNSGYRNNPNKKLQGGPAGETNIVNNLLNTCQKNSPVCTNPPNIKNNTSFLYSSSSLSLLERNAACKRSEVQEPDRNLRTPSKQTIMTTETLELLLKNYRRKKEKHFS